MKINIKFISMLIIWWLAQHKWSEVISSVYTLFFLVFLLFPWLSFPQNYILEQ